MSRAEDLAVRFERERPRLRSMAARMLGSPSEADDVVQETWLRLSRDGADDVHNLSAWLTTVCARICLNVLRGRRAHAEDPLEERSIETAAPEPSADPEHQAELADSIGLALLVVLDNLTPTERLALVLHDMFELPFDEIAPILDRTPQATRQLASRARRRIRGSAVPTRDVGRQRRLVEAYLAATRTGDFDALLSILHPGVVLRADAAAVPGRGDDQPTVLRGAVAVATGALASAARAQHTEPIMVGGTPGLLMAPAGSLRVVLSFAFTDQLISGIDVVADPARLAQLELSVSD